MCHAWISAYTAFLAPPPFLPLFLLPPSVPPSSPPPPPLPSLPPSLPPSLQVTNLQQLLTEATSESSLLHEKLTSSLSSLEEQTRTHGEEREHLLKRAEDLSQQNALLHEEAEKLSAKILTLQEQGREATPTLPVATVSTDTSADQLWEIIRWVSQNLQMYMYVKLMV